jgi:hypothetical protein
MVTTQCVDSLYSVILDSQQIPEDQVSDSMLSQINNAMWLLHKLLN